MRRISEWLDRHPKTRIALQLVLDGLPVLVMLLHLSSGYSVKMLTSGWDGHYRIVPSTFYYVTLVSLLIIPIPAFVASFLWRDKVVDLFEQYRWCRWISNLLRISGVVVTTIATLMDVFLLAIGLIWIYGWIKSML